MKLKNELVTIVFPKRCKYCGKIISLNDVICNSCKTDLPRINGKICKHCGFNKKDCTCRKRRNYYSSVIAPFYYEKAIRRLVNRMKFLSKKHMCIDMSEEMAVTIKREYKDISFDFLTYVPMTRESIKKREFNQAEVLATNLSKLLGIECKATLSICENNTNSQHFKGGFERASNAFGKIDVLDRNLISGKTILLIDDIKTTGATLNECAKVLRIFGAEEVFASTYAISRHNITNIDR